jgi:hypothetical protein
MSQWPPTSQSFPVQSGTVQPHRGVLILVFGILGIVVCVIFGVVAWVMGSGDLKAMAAGQMDRSGEGLTRAGQIIGMISVLLAALGIVIMIVMIALMGVAGAAGAGGRP